MPLACAACGGAIGAEDRFCASCGRAQGTAAEVQPSAESRVAEGRSFEADRRHITVLFSDIVNSTAHAQRLDLEDHGRIDRTKGPVFLSGQFGGGLQLAPPGEGHLAQIGDRGSS